MTSHHLPLMSGTSDCKVISSVTLTSHININTFSTGYQIHAVLLEKSKSSFGGACWKRSLNELESDCKSQKDKLIIWVFVTCKKVIILILLILETKRLAFAEL